MRYQAIWQATTAALPGSREQTGPFLIANVDSVVAAAAPSQHRHADAFAWVRF